MFVVTWCMSQNAHKIWTGEDGARWSSGEAVQTQMGGPPRSEEVGTIHSAFDLAEFVQSPKKPVLPRLVGAIEEETAVTGASLLLSAPGFPAAPHPKGSKHKKPP